MSTLIVLANITGPASPDQLSETSPYEPSLAIRRRPSKASPHQPSKTSPDQPSLTIPDQPGLAIPLQPNPTIPNQPSPAFPNQPSLAKRKATESDLSCVKTVTLAYQSCVFLIFSSFFVSHVYICAWVFLLTCNLIFFDAKVNWLPGSASPHGYSRQPVLYFWARVSTTKDCSSSKQFELKNLLHYITSTDKYYMRYNTVNTKYDHVKKFTRPFSLTLCLFLC